MLILLNPLPYFQPTGQVSSVQPLARVRSRLRDIHPRGSISIRRTGRSARDIFSAIWPTDDHAVCIFPFRRYEVCRMILYAKSSLELIVNNRIGKVGIRPSGRGPVTHPPVRPSARRHPHSPLRAAHLIWHWSQRVADLLLSVRPPVRPSVRLSVSPCAVRSVGPSVGMYPTRTQPSHHFRPGYERIYTRRTRTYTGTYVLLRINA